MLGRPRILQKDCNSIIKGCVRAPKTAGRGSKSPRNVLSRGLKQGGASISSRNREAGESNGWKATKYDTLRFATRRREGASRNTHKDYLHFLYIARGSLHETHYFIHLSGRLGYLDAEVKQRLMLQAEDASRTLTGLIKAVEKETNVISRAAARITSMLILSLGSSVFGLQSSV